MSNNESQVERAGATGTVLLPHGDVDSAFRARRQMPRLRKLWVLAAVLALGCWTTLALFGRAEVDARGFLHEPLFGLIPIGFALLMIALLLAVLDGALRIAARRR